MRKTLPLLALLAAASLVPTACGKKEAEVPTLTVDAGLGLGEGGTDGGDGGEAGLAPGLDAGADAADASAAVAPAAAAVDSALDLAIQTQAAKDAPGMTSEGQPGRATLTEGGSFNMLVTLQPGRCYTIIAMSPPLQVSQLEVKLLAPPLFNMEAGRSAPGDKNPAVLGKGKGATCPASPFAVPYRVDVVGRKGAGRVAVAVFSKAK